MIVKRTNKTETVAEMILIELANADQPLTSGDLYERLELDTSDTVIHAALRLLERDYRIEQSTPRLGKRGQPAKTYRLARSDASRLIEHLESELPHAPDSDTPRCVSCGAPVETAEASTCLECRIDTAEHEADARRPVNLAPVDDPVLRALARMDAREPRFQEGQMHVNRIRAIANHLDEGRPILPQMDVIAYLYDLANTIEAMSP